MFFGALPPTMCLTCNLAISLSDKSLGEKVFRIEFPERPGALLDFLNLLGDKWNITLFHYRNQGSAYGRVLVGFQVNPKETEKLTKHLVKTGFPFWNESKNSAYLSFLE